MPSELALLREKIEKCKKCGLCEETNNAVPGEGSENADIMFIGEAPGKDEDIQGKPFVGAAGKFLTKMIESIGLTRDDVFITNIVKHRPPNNRDPLEDEVETCSEFLEEQIRIIKPKLIVTLGRHAMNRFMPGLKISKDHGQAKRTQGIDGKKQVYFPLYHPASALYNPGLRETLIRDMHKMPILLKKIENDTQ
jgi:DNA polymerase